MKIVTDTSALIAVLLDEPEADAIIRLTIDNEVVAPLSLRFEVANALTNVQRDGRRSLQELHAAFESFQMMRVEYLEVDLVSSLTIAVESGLMAYDAFMLCCAIDNQLPLLTLDKRLRNEARRKGVQVMEVPSEFNQGT